MEFFGLAILSYLVLPGLDAASVPLHMLFCRECLSPPLLAHISSSWNLSSDVTSLGDPLGHSPTSLSVPQSVWQEAFA